MAMTMLLLLLPSLMLVGGVCAEGGPYEIVAHCPAGINGGTFFFVLLGIVCIFTYGASLVRGGPDLRIHFWAIFFALLGAEGLWFAFQLDGRDAVAMTMLAVFMIATGIVPAIFMGRTDLWYWLVGSSVIGTRKRRLLLGLHGVGIAVGIALGSLMVFWSRML